MATACPAVAAAQKNKNLGPAELAQQLGTSESHVNSVLSGQEKPTSAEFNKLASALDIKQSAPADSAHATR